MSRPRRIRVVFEQFSEEQNAEMRRGEAGGKVWAREMAQARDVEPILTPLFTMDDLGVIRIDFFSRFLMWVLVLRPAINEFQGQFGDDKSKETYRQGMQMDRPDYVRGFYQGALAFLAKQRVEGHAGPKTNEADKTAIAQE